MYMYIYIHTLLCSKMGCFFAIHSWANSLPFMRSIRGARSPGPQIPIFIVFPGGGGPEQLFSRVREISGVILGHYAENEVVQNTFLLFIYIYIYIYGHLLLGSIGYDAGFFLRCAKMPRTTGKMGFYIVGLKFAT